MSNFFIRYHCFQAKVVEKLLKICYYIWYVHKKVINLSFFKDKITKNTMINLGYVWEEFTQTSTKTNSICLLKVSTKSFPKTQGGSEVVIKTGVDIIETKRIQESIEKFGEKFLNRIFTIREIEYCERKQNQKFQSYAARFAAKEAVFKAISEEITNKYDIEWKEIEIINDKNGRPHVNLLGKLAEKLSESYQIDVSLSHINEIAIASCIAKPRKD